MTAAFLLRTVLMLWGDHWQQPCLALLAKHGHRYTRQTLWNWKTGKTPVPEFIEVILTGEAKEGVPKTGGHLETLSS
ncbi:MAG: hypothetical protein U0790_23380 [Isosphaeraceae bacterium]